MGPFHAKISIVNNFSDEEKDVVYNTNDYYLGGVF